MNELDQRNKIPDNKFTFKSYLKELQKIRKYKLYKFTNYYANVNTHLTDLTSVIFKN